MRAGTELSSLQRPAAYKVRSASLVVAASGRFMRTGLIRQLCLLLILLIGSQAAAYADPAKVRILGRSEPISGGGFTIQWPSSGFEARLIGAKLTARIEDNGSNWLNVEVDGKSSRLQLKAGAHAYVLFSGNRGVHTIRVTRRTASAVGPTRFLGFQTDGKLEGTVEPSRRILAIGDFIMAGYGVEGADQYCRFSNETQNADLAFPALLGRTFAADVQTIAVDGTGLSRNFDGFGKTMTTLAWLTLASTELQWPTATSTPQVIIIHLGTNDFAAGNPVPAFEKTYVDFLIRIRATYNQAQVFAVFGGMLSGEAYTRARDGVKAAVAQRQSAGDDKVHFLELNPPRTARRYGCNWHPGLDAQQAMAHSLQTEIHRYLDW
ncbi:MAG: GDSL-type esterase/lipase family protein [Hyphomonadaceae bacterium]